MCRETAPRNSYETEGAPTQVAVAFGGMLVVLYCLSMDRGVGGSFVSTVTKVTSLTALSVWLVWLS